MDWFNIYGLIMMSLVMLPNLIYAVIIKDGFVNLWQNRAVERMEQIGRYGCFALMVVNIPGTWFGFWFDGALTVYLTVGGVLLAAYLAVWAVCFRRNSVFRALALSILPCALFLFCGIMLRSVLLIAAALLLAPCHILISCRNTVLALPKEDKHA